MIQRCRVAGFNFDFCLPDGHPLCLELDNYLPFSCSEAGDFRLRCFDEVRPAEGYGMSVAGTDSGVRIGLAPSPESPVLATLELNSGYSSGVLSMIPSCGVSSPESPASSAVSSSAGGSGSIRPSCTCRKYQLSSPVQGG